jgi:hypothetical protein
MRDSARKDSGVSRSNPRTIHKVGGRKGLEGFGMVNSTKGLLKKQAKKGAGQGQVSAGIAGNSNRFTLNREP